MASAERWRARRRRPERASSFVTWTRRPWPRYRMFPEFRRGGSTSPIARKCSPFSAKEIAKHRVRFNLIAPGVIDTSQYRAANAGTDDAHWRSSVGVGQAQDTVGPLMFLLSDAATMTASVISRDLAYPAQDGEA